MGIDFLFRRETSDDYKIGANATHFDNVDLIEGPDHKLGLVAVHQGRRVCQQCGDGFNQSIPKLRMVPVHTHPEAPPVYLHAKCEVPPIKIFNMFRGLQIRRGVADIVKQSQGIVESAAESAAEREKGG